MVSKLFVATKAFLVHNDKVLILEESGAYQDGTNAGRCDVVGGRVEMGQRFDDSLLREIKEETGLTARIGRPFHVGEWRPVVRGQEWQIVGTFFECFVDSDTVVLSRDHGRAIWIQPDEYQKYPLIDNLRPAFVSYLAYRASLKEGN